MGGTPPSPSSYRLFRSGMPEQLSFPGVEAGDRSAATESTSSIDDTSPTGERPRTPFITAKGIEAPSSQAKHPFKADPKEDTTPTSTTPGEEGHSGTCCPSTPPAGRECHHTQPQTKVPVALFGPNFNWQEDDGRETTWMLPPRASSSTPGKGTDPAPDGDGEEMAIQDQLPGRLSSLL